MYQWQAEPGWRLAVNHQSLLGQSPLDRLVWSRHMHAVWSVGLTKKELVYHEQHGYYGVKDVWSSNLFFTSFFICFEMFEECRPTFIFMTDLPGGFSFFCGVVCQNICKYLLLSGENDSVSIISVVYWFRPWRRAVATLWSHSGGKSTVQWTFRKITQ